MSELTNLLPNDRVRALKSEYYIRLLTLLFLAVGMLALIHGALLAPTYIYLSEEVKTREAHLNGLAASLATSEEQEIAARIAALSGDAERLLSLSTLPSASSAARRILDVPKSGIVVSGITISRPETGQSQVRIIGTASTRESLRKYHEALSALPGVEKADLPLSVYAQESDISFSIALIGTLTP